MPVLVEGGADDDGFLWFTSQSHVDVDGLSVLEILHVGRELSAAVLNVKGQLVPLSGNGAETGSRGGRQIGFSHWEDSHGAFGDLPGLFAKPQEGDRVQSHVTVVRNGQRHAETVVSYIVVVPLLQTGKTTLDIRTVINRQEALGKALASGNLYFSAQTEPADVFIICVQTPHKDTPEGKRVADLRYVEAAASSVGKVIRAGNLCVLESTSPPYTTQLVEKILSETSGLTAGEFMTAHCPERIIPGRMLVELKENDRIIGATRLEAAEYAKKIYTPVVTGGTIRVTDDLTAEMCKLVENTYRDINIAYANELSMVCERLGIDVFDLIEMRMDFIA